MKVKSLREHSNHHGLNFIKKQGEVYDHRDPSADIVAGIVKPAGDEEALTAKRPKKTSTKPVSGSKVADTAKK